MDIREVEQIVRAVLIHYGVGCSVGRVARSGRDWHVEVIDAFRTKTTVIIPNDTPQGVRRAIMGALDVDG